MISAPVSVGTVSLILLVSVVSPQPAFLSPQQNEAVSLDVLKPYLEPYGSVAYQLSPNNNYAVAAVEPTELSILDYILSPATAVTRLGSKALSLVSWVATNGCLVFLGMAIVIGFCALTPYCTLTIEKPSFLARENFSYLENLEYFFNEAYNKYQEIQNSVYD